MLRLPHLSRIAGLRSSIVMHFAVVMIASIAVTSCGASSSTPTSPTTNTPTTTPTRIIGVSGSLAFGTVSIGTGRTASFTITNSGNSPLTVTGISAAANFVTQSALSWSSGTIAAGGSQTVIILFTPTTAGTYAGTVTVNGDQTSGTNTIEFSAEAANNAPFTGNWSGTYIVERCDGSGSLQDLFCSAPSGSRPGGIFPIGSALPITLNLVQSGSAVTGALALGTVTGPVTGTVTGDVLTLSGTLTLTSGSSSSVATIVTWSTQVSGNRMTGTQSYSVSVTSVPGTLVMTTRLNSVTK